MPSSLRVAACGFVLNAFLCLCFGQTFTPGHVFLSEAGEPCSIDPGAHRIIEVDPETGAWWYFATSDQGVCSPAGLSFMPDGRFLRAVSFTRSEVHQFDPAANRTVVYDRDDLMNCPQNITYNCQGDFFAYNYCSRRLLKFERDQPPPLIFGDQADGFFGQSFIAVAPDGSVFTSNYEQILRFTPDGQVSVFDQFPSGAQFVSLAFDRAGNLFAVVHGAFVTGLYRYEEARAEKRTLLPLAPAGELGAIVVAPNQRELYGARINDAVLMSAENGDWRILAEGWGFDNAFTGPGIAVYVPLIHGDLNCDSSVNTFDIQPFIQALSDCAAYGAAHGLCNRWQADINHDGSVNQFDIQPFIDLLGP